MEAINRVRSICVMGRVVDFSVPAVMGIINYTPDSFYDGGKYRNPDAVAGHAVRLAEDGADIIDVGAVSTRPGAPGISEKEETGRLAEALEAIRKELPEVILSVDTWRSGVAEIMIRDYGAGIINDISAGRLDDRMLDTAGKLKVPYIAMHMQGTPATMQENPVYRDVVNDIILYFSERVRIMRDAGIDDIIIDPGFGFGKSVDHNYEIAARLKEFHVLELPVLAGFSRKSMIYKVLGRGPGDALGGTIALNTVAVMNGAHILRVHDVREARDTIEVAMRLKRVVEHGK
ncbi:MAG: dihydropteroate synthase [Marinilabiliales bacterium]|nr:MAG: dihydropteroate synthase [Marinilabiliales bacterium]